MSKIFKSKEDRSITDEELLTIVEEAQQEGGIDKDEGELIKNAIEFDDLQAEDVLTPPYGNRGRSPVCGQRKNCGSF